MKYDQQFNIKNYRLSHEEILGMLYVDILPLVFDSFIYFTIFFLRVWQLVATSKFFQNYFVLELCSLCIFLMSLAEVGWVILIRMSNALCHPSTELFVLGIALSTLDLTFHNSMRNKGRRLLP